MNLARVYDSLDQFDDAMATACEADVLGDMLHYMSDEYLIDTTGLIFIKANIHFHKEEYKEAMNIYQ